jgi:hypothetical protein
LVACLTVHPNEDFREYCLTLILHPSMLAYWVVPVEPIGDIPRDNPCIEVASPPTSPQPRPRFAVESRMLIHGSYNKTSLANSSWSAWTGLEFQFIVVPVFAERVIR